MLERQIRTIWDQLRAKKASFTNYLDEIRLERIRGIADLRIQFPYPVSVLAGTQGCGKSTVLFALACAYNDPSKGPRELVPSQLFPQFRSKSTPSVSQDVLGNPKLSYGYTASGSRLDMAWSRGANWNRSFAGRPGAEQPERLVYLRTLANLSNPSEVRSVLQMGQKTVTEERLDASYLAFAQRILPFKYKSVSKIENITRDILFVKREGPIDLTGEFGYSEFQMSAGERSILRLSHEISHLSDAIVLIDEIEAGLHPFTQQQLMLELQRLALRNNLQVVVTTHSPAILDTVPLEGRILLKREDDNVVSKEPYRHIIQNSLYGRSFEKLNVLCEDIVAEAVIRGALDHVGPKLDLMNQDIVVGRDTGKDQFSQHVEALSKFQKLDEFLFVLDGDAKNLEPVLRQKAPGVGLRLLFLPGEAGPEVWVWDILKTHVHDYSEQLGSTASSLLEKMAQIAQVFEAATNKKSEIAKHKLDELAAAVGQEAETIARVVGRTEARRDRGEFFEFVSRMEEAFRDWRNK